MGPYWDTGVKQLCHLSPCSEFFLEAKTQKLDVKCEVPAVTIAIEDAVGVASIYEYESLLADSFADELLKGVSLSSEVAIDLRFPVLIERNSERSYYGTHLCASEKC